MQTHAQGLTVMNRASKVVHHLVIGAVCAALIFTMSACSVLDWFSGSDDKPAASPTVADTEEDKQQETSVDVDSTDGDPAAADAEVAEEPVEAILGIAPTGPELTDKWGTYRQAQLLDDSEILDYDKKVVGKLKKYSDEDVASAVKWTAQFFVSEGLDSEMARSNRKRDRKSAWMRMRNSFTNSVWGPTYMAIEKPEPDDNGYWFALGNPNNWRGERGIKEQYVPGELTYRPKSIAVQKVRQKKGLLEVTFKFAIERTIADGDGAKYVSLIKGTQSYQVEKNSSGQWTITNGASKWSWNAKPVEE